MSKSSRGSIRMQFGVGIGRAVFVATLLRLVPLRRTQSLLEFQPGSNRLAPRLVPRKNYVAAGAVVYSNRIMPIRFQLKRFPCLILAAFTLVTVARGDDLDSGFGSPPPQARARAYWWWLNGNVTKAAITRDLEEMKAKGFGGAIITDAGGAEQEGNAQVPAGPAFFSPEWRELFKFTLHEADRLGLEMSLNIQSGWNLGGPMIRAEDAPKKLTWSQTRTHGPVTFTNALAEPKHAPELYRDILVLAFPVGATTNAGPPLKNFAEKSLVKGLGWSTPDCAPLLQESTGPMGGEDTDSGKVIDITRSMDGAGFLRWEVPSGDWEILRLGYTLNDHSKVSTSSESWQGYALDPIDGKIFRSYWDQVVEPLIADAGPLAGHAFRYLHTDSWEVEVLNWTPTLREEFRHRRGYDLLPFLPVMAGYIVDSRSVSDRFLYDFRRTIGDLAVDNHYKLFSDGAHRHGMEIHPESGGPHSVPVDSLQCLGMDDAPMSEFWARSPVHRVADTDRFFIKQPASAAHTYGHKLVVGEGFTDIGLHWQETLWDNLKPTFDRAIGEGLNRLVWHAFVCSPAELGLPGQQYFAGTHINPNTTWWPLAGPFLNYLNRCQFLMQQGLFVGDVCQYYGDGVPNFTQLKRANTAKVQPGYDYDVATAEVLLTRMSARDGRIVLPDGMSYRLLVLPESERISLPVLRRVKELVAAGATVIGPRPAGATGLVDYPQSDVEVASLAQELWGKSNTDPNGEHRFGKGRVIWGKTAHDVLAADGVRPDFEFSGATPGVQLDYIHRRDAGTEIYFVANPTNHWENVTCAFRVAGKAPELWLADSGEIRRGIDFSEKDGRTEVPLRLEPYGSAFVVFRSPASGGAMTATRDGQPIFVTGSARDFDGATQMFARDGQWVLQTAEAGLYDFTNSNGRMAHVTVASLPPAETLAGGWTLGAPLKPLDVSTTQALPLSALKSWTEFDDPNLKYFSGTLAYTREIDIDTSRLGEGLHVWLDLGTVHELAEVEVNGQKLGVLWKPPWRVDITSAVHAGKNQLVVRVTNFWPNRIIGDQFLPAAQRVTWTNIRKLTRATPLMPSGLIGPVRVLTTSEKVVKF